MDWGRDMTFYIKQGNTSPALLRQMRDGTGAPVNLTGATVDFSLAKVAGPLVLSRVAAAVWSGPVTLDDGSTITVSPVDGWMRFVWPSGGIVDAGVYHCEFNATFSGGALETVPNSGYEEVHVGKKLA